MAAVVIPTVTNWSVTPQNGQENYFVLMNTWLSESTSVIASFNTAIVKTNESNAQSNSNLVEVIEARDITVQAKNEAVTAIATLTAGAIDDTTIATNKAFSNSYIKTNYYDKHEVDSKTIINNFIDEPTPDDTDNLALQEAGGLLKKLSWVNLKETLKNIFLTKPELVTITGTAIFNGIAQTINITGIGNLGLEVGDIIKITGTSNNNKLFRVEHIKDDWSGLITDNNTIIVNYEHRNSSTTKRLINETTIATITLYNKAKNAPFGQGCDWCTPASPRVPNVTYSADLPIMVSVGTVEVFIEFKINGLTVAFVDGGTSVGSSVSAFIQKDSVYRVIGSFGNYHIFKEFR